MTLRLRSLARRDRVEEELDEEVRFHIEMETERLLRRGVPPQEARRRALVAFGGVERFKEQSREARGTRHLEVTVQDVRYALRALRKNPLFTVVAVLTLALGIGGVTAIFSVVRAVLLEPLPFKDPDQLALLWTHNPEEGQDRYFVSPQDFGDWREQATTFSGMSAYWPTTGTLTGVDEVAQQITQVFTTENYFDVLGVPPLLGRTFGAGDGPGSTQVVILSEALWRSSFGADPAVVGRDITIDGSNFQVVGVVADRQRWPAEADLWINMNWPMTIQGRIARWMSVVGRLEPGAGVERARADMAAVATRLGEIHEEDRGWGVAVEGLADTVVGSTRSALWILLASTAFILLIACANVANLLLSRAEVRAREVAVRQAFGAGRRRIARQLLTESLVLATLGGVAGLGLAWAGIAALRRIAPAGLPRVDEVGLNGGILLAVVGATLLTGLLFGLAPVVRILGPGSFSALREGARGTRGVRGIRLQNAFVVAQLALAVILVVGAGLLVRSFMQLRAVDTGFRADGLLTLQLDVSQGAAEEDQGVIDFYDRYLARVREIPGVRSAAAVSTLPLGEGLDYSQPFSIVDDPTQPGQERRAFFRHASPEVFETLGTPLDEGRTLQAADRLDAPGAVVVNEAMARRFFPGEDPVGHRLAGLAYRWGPLGAVLMSEAEIVGVVKDMPYEGIRTPAQPAFYFSFRQGPMRRMTVLLRTDGDPLTLVDGARAALAEVNPQVAMSRVRAMHDVVGDAMARDRFSTLLLVAFGVMALVLAAVGVYGVLAYAVAQRSSELGIRMALGASAADVRRMVLREGGAVAGLGLLLGLAAALLLAGFLSSQLYGVGPRDPVVYGIVTSVLAAVAVVASLVPALRATRVDPVTAMRGE